MVSSEPNGFGRILQTASAFRRTEAKETHYEKNRRNCGRAARGTGGDGGGGFSSCSGGSSYAGTADEAVPRVFTAVDLKIDDPIVEVTPVNGNIVGVANIEQTAKVVAEDGKHITSFTLTPKKAGSTHIVIKTNSSGTVAIKYLPVTVSSSLALSAGELTDTEPAEENPEPNSATILYFDSSAETATATGTTESSVVTLGAAVLTWGSVSGSGGKSIPITGASGPKADTGTAAGKDYTATAYSSDKLSFEKADVKENDIIATLKFTVTPSKKISLKKFEGVAGNTMSGNMSWSVKIDGTSYDFTNVNDTDNGKYAKIDKELSGDKTSAFDVEIIAKASKNEAFNRSDGAIKVWFGDLKLTFVEAE